MSDISLESVKRIIPPSLYWLVRIMITSNETEVKDFDQPSPCAKIEDERRILSIAQDIIHCASNSQVVCKLLLLVQHF